VGDFIDDTCATLDSLKESSIMDKVTSNLPVLIAGAAIGGLAACLFMKRCSLSAPSLPFSKSNGVLSSHMRGGGTRAKGALSHLSP